MPKFRQTKRRDKKRVPLVTSWWQKHKDRERGETEDSMKILWKGLTTDRSGLGDTRQQFYRFKLPRLSKTSGSPPFNRKWPLYANTQLCHGQVGHGCSLGHFLSGDRCRYEHQPVLQNRKCRQMFRKNMRFLLLIICEEQKGAQAQLARQIQNLRTLWW